MSLNVPELAVWLFIVTVMPAQAVGPRPDVMKKICATSFGQGEMARVDVLLDKAKAVKVLALRPDISRFSHAPHTYFDPDGTTLLVVPERPITPEQAQSDPVLLQQRALLRDLAPGQPVYCKNHR